MLQLIDSRINGTIKVKRFLWQTSVWAGGFQQSGPLVENLWKKAIKVFSLGIQGEHLRNVLILGLGCGSVIKPLRQKFPHCHITGVEIDPEIIKIGKKYFSLSKISKLKIVCEDANDFIKKNKKKFDLVIIDLYKGQKKVSLGNLKTKLFKSVMINLLSRNSQGNWENKIKVFGPDCGALKRL